MSREQRSFPSPGEFGPTKRRRRILSGLCLCAAILLAGYARLSWVRTHASTPALIARLNRMLPSLPVTDASGRAADVRTVVMGSRSVIAFYSPSCHVCQTVLPELRPFPATLRLVLVNEEARKSLPPQDTMDEALEFRDSNRAFSRSFPMSGLPTILFVDEQGILRAGLVGEHARGLLRPMLKEFAREQQ